MVHYVDEDLLIPIIHTVVFVGRNLEADDVGMVYFQDVESYREGVRHDDASQDSAMFFCGSESELGAIFDYEHPLNELLRCSVRRQAVKESSCSNQKN